VKHRVQVSRLDIRSVGWFKNGGYALGWGGLYTRGWAEGTHRVKVEQSRFSIEELRLEMVAGLGLAARLVPSVQSYIKAILLFTDRLHRSLELYWS
jgi:hypothetical protein